MRGENFDPTDPRETLSTYRTPADAWLHDPDLAGPGEAEADADADAESEPRNPDLVELGANEADDDAEAESVGSINIGPGTIDPREFQMPRRSTVPDYYIAILLLGTTSEESGHQPLYEESFVLVKAESEPEAKNKATDLAKQQQDSYRDENHTLVSWQLIEVLDVKRLEDTTFDDGTELYSRLFRDYQAYRSFEPRLDGEL